MPAKIKMYLDEECTQELYRNDTGAFLYRYRHKNEDGSYTPYIDGNVGGKFDITIYLKNVGTRAAINTRLIRLENTESANFIQEELLIPGDIPVDKVVKVSMKAVIDPWTPGQLHKTSITLDYYSLPDPVTEVTPYVKTISFANNTNIDDIHIKSIL